MDESAVILEEKKLLLEQYKAYLEDLQEFGSRNESGKRFMLSILSALLLFLTLTSDDGAFFEIRTELTWVIFGIAETICIAWMLRNRTSSLTLKSKFEVLQEMEKNLLFKCFTREWDLRKARKWVYLTTIDMWIPIAIAIAFLAAVFPDGVTWLLN